MTARWFSMLAIGAVVACGRDREEIAVRPDSVHDTVALVSPDSATARGPSVSPTPRGTPSKERPVLVVQVQEETPGLLKQARVIPLDAQHIAQGKYPKGTVQSGWLERRGKDLVYRFRIRDEDGSIHDVLVDSLQGTIINTIPVQ